MSKSAKPGMELTLPRGQFVITPFGFDAVVAGAAPAPEADRALLQYVEASPTSHIKSVGRKSDTVVLAWKLLRVAGR